MVVGRIVSVNFLGMSRPLPGFALVIQHRDGAHRRAMAATDSQREAEEHEPAAGDLGEVRQVLVVGDTGRRG
jgi:hypothetical protein